MSDAIWIAVSSVAGVLGLGISYFAYRERRADRISTGEADRVKSIVHAETESITARQLELSAQLENIVTRQAQLIQDIRSQNDRIGTMLDRLAVLETKTEVFWRSVAMDAAKIIHSPDPRRKNIDELLDAFMNGRLTPEQEAELRNILEVMRDYEPGVTSLTFPVYPGEQIAAAILLRTLDVNKVGTKGGG